MTDRIELPIDGARTVTLVTAIEDADTNGDWLSPAEREEATRRARAGLGDEPDAARVGAAIEARSVDLLRRATEKEPLLGRLGREIPLSLLIAIALAIPVLYGLGRSVLGSETTIDIFANPLVVLILWNFVVGVLGILFALLRRRSRAPLRGEDPTGETTRAPWIATRLGEWLLTVGASARLLRRADHTGLLARVVTGFGTRWQRIAGARHASTAQLLLQVTALLLLATAVGEAYVRGLFTEYEAKWESTWLEPPQASELADLVFGIPARLLGTPIELPEEGAKVDAGEWIHRFAIAALIFGALPRLILLFISIGSRHRGAQLIVPISPTLARRLLARVSTRFARVTVLPYSSQLPDGGNDRLRGILVELLGERAVIEIAPPLPYGAEEPELEPGENLCRVVLFGLAQPPETEVHRDFLDRVAAAGAPTIAIIDASSYRRRFGEDAEGRTRIDERRRAWDRVLDGDGETPIAHLDLSRDLDDAGFARLSNAVGQANGTPR